MKKNGLSGRILLIDDSKETLRMLTILLEEKGYAVYQALGGVIGLKIAEKAEPDLIILDIKMPGMDGYETCRRLKQIPALRSTPVIFMSGISELSEKVKAFRGGGVDYITKPIQGEEALARVDTHLRLRAARHDLEIKNRELEAAKENLEDIVRSRTRELERINQALGNEVEEKKRTENELRESEAGYRALYNNTPVMMHSIDAEGRILRVNDHWLKTLGYPKEEVMGRKSTEFLTEASRRYALEEVLPDFFKNGFCRNIEYQMVKKNGKIIDVSLSAILENDPDGKPYRSLAFLLDTTDWKRAETESQAKSEFLSHMSHELRTPLNAILGFSEILDKMIADPKQRDYFNRIRTSGKALLTLINDILDLSKIEAGKLELQYGPVSLGRLFEETKQMFTHKLAEKRLEMPIDIAPGLPDALLLDGIRMRQVIINLVSNAVKFTDSGAITLSARVEDPGADGRGRNDVVVSVADTGMGVPADQLEMIFHPFEQQKRKEKHYYGGAGLGLAITRRLVEAMGGAISVESRVGRGSVFTVTLNDVETAGPDAARVAEEEPFDFSEVRFEPAKVLIAEDIDDNRKLLRGYYSGCDLDLIEAENGREAVDKARRLRPDLILMDMKMPVMDGYAAVAEIRGSESETRDIPIIAVTASALKQDEERIRKICDGYLRKPVSRSALIKKTMKFLPHTVRTEQSEKTEKKEPAEKPIALGATPEKPPPEEAMDKIVHLAKAGLFGRLNHILAELTEKDPACTSFCRRLENFTKTYNAEGILKHVEKLRSRSGWEEGEVKI